MEELNASLVAFGERLVVAVLVVIVALVALRVGPRRDPPQHRGHGRPGGGGGTGRCPRGRPQATGHGGDPGALPWLVFVTVVASLTVLSQLGVDVGPAITGLGIVGIAIGFGAQQIVRDYFGGTLILLENQYAKGDVVTLVGVTGVVEEFTLRRTVLRDTDGIVHNVPNGAIVVASNRTRVWRRINQDVVIAYGHDVEQAIAVLDEVGQRLAADPGVARPHPGGAAGRSRRPAGRPGRDAQDPGHGARRRPPGGGRGAAASPGRGHGGQRPRPASARAARLEWAAG